MRTERARIQREVSGTPNIPPPGVPTGLTATAANRQVALAWNAITGATSYNVKRATTTGGPYAKVGSSTVATYTETGLSNGTAYYYVVSAVKRELDRGKRDACHGFARPDSHRRSHADKPISPWIYGIAANLWPPNGTYDYALAGFRVFRGFDGANANFGDSSVPATSSDISKVAVYASTDSTAPGRVVFAAINRFTAAHVTAISGLSLSGMATVYQITAASAQGQTPVHPVLVGQMPVGGQSFTVTLPALSVSTIEVK